MRILRYSCAIRLRSWVTYTLVDCREITDRGLGTEEFDKIVAAVKRFGFWYEVVSREDVLVEGSGPTIIEL